MRHPNHETSGRRPFLRSMFASSLLMPGVVSQLCAAEDGNASANDNPLAPKKPHWDPPAKNVIFIYATGGVSHIDTFDPKSPEKGRDGSGKDKLMGNKFGSARNAKCGTEVSDIFPHMREVMDEVCLIRSMNASHFDHSEATLGMHTGSPTFARPSIGSWVSYGLGTFNQDLPGFIVIAPHLPYGGTQVFASDFLPAVHQGTRVLPGDEPIANLVAPGRSARLQELEFDLVNRMNAEHIQQRPFDSALAARIKSFETAFQMQQAAPEAFDISQEPDHVRKLYGLDRKVKGPGADFGWQCLVARRLAERGVRFIELIDTGSRPNWDSHGEMNEHKDLAYNVDQPTAGLIKDLNNAVCSMTRLCCGPRSLAERRHGKARTAAGIIATVSAFGLQAVVSKAGTSTEPRTRLASTPSKTLSKFTTCTQPCFINSAWTTKSSLSATPAATSV